jgi:hypothetical protein
MTSMKRAVSAPPSKPSGPVLELAAVGKMWLSLVLLLALSLGVFLLVF